MAEAASDWDPSSSSDHELSDQARERILRDIKEFAIECPLPSMKVYFDEEDMGKVHVLMIGELYTPYEGGFFYFLVRYPRDYPAQPPRVKNMTTGCQTVRFNPNIYKNGMVCHSILGTWDKASWQQRYRLRDVLEVIQGMLNEHPYGNEPSIHPLRIFFPFLDIPTGKFPELNEGDSDRYNDVIRHETLRVAVCDMLEPGTVDMPSEMRSEIRKRFKKFYPMYLEKCDKYDKLEGNLDDIDPFSHCNLAKLIEKQIGIAPPEFLVSRDQELRYTSVREVMFDYKAIRLRIEHIKAELDEGTAENEQDPIGDLAN